MTTAPRPHRSEHPGECIFCALPADRILRETPLALAFRDQFPVTPLHSLVIPKRHAIDYFDLTADEVRDCHELIRWLRAEILAQDPVVSGFNVGMNCGLAAGQTVFHCHIHVIPRRTGDHPQPKGGVRAVIPGKAVYER